jgi:ADP-ribose pyrophosphatase YjhB (NUDIX family)
MEKIIISSGPVIVEEGKVLLNRHGDDGFWKFCGGKVENMGTSLSENAHREVQEEMGIEIEILKSVPYITYTTKDTPDGKIDVILAHFLAKRLGDIRPGNDILESGWFPLDALPENLAPNIRPVLEFFGFLE